MNHWTSRFLPALCCLALLSSPAASQTEAHLVGTWVGADQETEGEKLVFNKNGTCDLDGDAVRWSVPAAGVLRVALDGEPYDCRYEIDGNRLTLIDEGDRMNYRRVGAAPPKPGGNPLGGAPAENPPGGSPPSPFARSFTGENIALQLESAGDEGFRGTLEFQGQKFPVKARAAGEKLTGTFASQGNDFPFTAVLSGDDLKLTSGGRTYQLVGAKRSPANPLGGAAGDAAKRPGPKPLAGVDGGTAKRFQHPRGFYSFEMPAGWSVWKQSDEALMLNPGLKETDSLDAIIAVTHGRLDEADRNKDLLELLQGNEGELRQSLRQQGLELGAVKLPPKKVAVGEVPGAVCSWRARAATGSEVEIWFGGLVMRDYYLSVLAIIVDGKQDRFLPKVKRVFTTMLPKPPKPNPKLQQALVGRGFFSGSSSDGNSFHATYDFVAGNQVMKKMMFSGSQGVGGGSSEEQGRYEVVGDVVYMYFRDGQESAQVVTAGGQITGLRFGQKVYRPR